MKRSSLCVGAVMVTLLGAFGLAQAGSLPDPLTDADFRRYPDAQVELGRLLFYDRVLSGTYFVSCATCHNHDRASSNGFRLDRRGSNDAAAPTSDLSAYQRLRPSDRHAPVLFNLGAKQVTRLFTDGRVERLPDGSLRTPANGSLPDGLNDVLAAQALFPAVSSTEMNGQGGTDPSRHAHEGNAAIWRDLANRVNRIDEYRAFIERAYPVLDGQPIDITGIANAIGAFVATEWRSDDAPFDRYLRGDATALDDEQKSGLSIFFGKGGCGMCHSGALTTDHQFHRVGLSEPVDDQVDPLDLGRIAVTGQEGDRYAYRTPSLRNVERTGPWGRTGAYDDLNAFIDAHLAKGRAHDMPDAPVLTEAERAGLRAFLSSLTDERSLLGRLGKPSAVPSSLTVD